MPVEPSRKSRSGIMRRRLGEYASFPANPLKEQLGQMQTQPPQVAQMPTYAPSPTLEALSRMRTAQGRMQPSLSSTPARLRGSLSARSRQFSKPNRKVGY
jgi:hypothetical protein